MPYQSKPFYYDRFFRSGTSPSFDRFNRDDAFIAWIDLLGVRNMNHAQIISAVKQALEVAAECSSTGPILNLGGTPPEKVMVGTPQSAVQYVLVGDALLLVDKELPETPNAATLAFIYRVCFVSRILHELGYVHRGVITRGAVYCDRIDDSTILTGAGVVKAAGLEANLKVAGLFYDDTLTPFINQRAGQIQQHNWFEPFAGLQWNATQYAPNLIGTIFSQYHGWELWKQTIANGTQTFSNITHASTLIQELITARGLP